MKKLVPAFLAACAALSLTACSSDAGASSDEPAVVIEVKNMAYTCLLYTSPSPRDGLLSRMPSSA